MSGRPTGLLRSSSPRVVLVAGTNGAGKTTLIDLLPSLVAGQRIDPDAIAAEVDSDAPEQASLAAGRLALSRIADALAARTDFTVETTLSGRQPLQLLQQARQLGYHISLVFVGTSDPRLNIDRIRRRIAAGGHPIEADDVLRRYQRSLNHLREASALADAVAIFDNSGEPHELRVVYDRDEHGEYIADDVPEWLTIPSVRRGGS